MPPGRVAELADAKDLGSFGAILAGSTPVAPTIWFPLRPCPWRLRNFPFLIRVGRRYRAGMALVRILVDGYSLLHDWPELANGHARHSAAARDALIRRLTHYQDAVGTAITIFFDGAGRRGPAPPQDAEHAVEVLFSGNGKTADQMIERAAHRFAAWGEVLAVTDDNTERDTVSALGGFASSCREFIRTVEDALGEQVETVNHYNRRERDHYHRRR